MTDQNKSNPTREFVLAFSRMPPALLLLIIIGLAFVIANMVTMKISSNKSKNYNWAKIAQAHRDLQCPKCHSVMQAGVITSTGTRGIYKTIWQSDPDLSNPEDQAEGVVSFRCLQCGYLESYSK